jgi:hypothetical protein
MAEHEWKVGDLAWTPSGPSAGRYYWRAVVVRGTDRRGMVICEVCNPGRGRKDIYVLPGVLRRRAEGDEPPARTPIKEILSLRAAARQELEAMRHA